VRITSADAGRVFYALQPGLALWEAPRAEPDPSSATLSLCADTPARLRRLFGRLLAADPGRGAWLRWHACDVAGVTGAVSRRRLEAALSRDLPGFAATLLARGRAGLAAISRLTTPEDVDLDDLSFYRRTVLVCAPDPAMGPRELWDAVAGTEAGRETEVDGRALRAMRAALPGALLYRVLDLETHAVAQALGEPARVGEIAARLDGWAVPRLAEPGEVPVRIDAWA
jgi:hypothetical protein